MAQVAIYAPGPDWPGQSRGEMYAGSSDMVALFFLYQKHFWHKGIYSKSPSGQSLDIAKLYSKFMEMEGMTFMCNLDIEICDSLGHLRIFWRHRRVRTSRFQIEVLNNDILRTIWPPNSLGGQI